MQNQLEEATFAGQQQKQPDENKEGEQKFAAEKLALEEKVAELQAKVVASSKELQTVKGEMLQLTSEAREAAKEIEEHKATIANLKEAAKSSEEGTLLEKELASELEVAKALEAEARREADSFKARAEEISGELAAQTELMDELVEASANSAQVQAELAELKQRCAALQGEADRAQELSATIAEYERSGASASVSPEGSRAGGLAQASRIPQSSAGAKGAKPRTGTGGRRRGDSNAPKPSGTRRRAASNADDSSLPSYMRPTGRTRDPPTELTTPSYMRSTKNRVGSAVKDGKEPSQLPSPAR